MKGTTKKQQAGEANKQVSPLLIKEGAKALGPGVVKRMRREDADIAQNPDEPSYTPSEQVFRRRS